MLKMVNVSIENVAVLEQMEVVLLPCIKASLTEAGICQTEEGIQCLTMILYGGYKNKTISKDLLDLLP
jgi:hypothetical protein